MRVGISGLAVGNAGGIGRLSRTCLLALAAARPDWDFHVYLRSQSHSALLAEECDRESRPLLDLFTYHYAAAGWLNRLALEELDLPLVFSKLRLDAYLGLDFTLPTARLAPHEVVVIPDLLPFTHPQTISLRARWLYRRGLRRAVARRARLVCISEQTRTELLRQFPEAQNLAAVAVPALSPRLARLAASSNQRDHRLQVRGNLGAVIDPGRFLLYVGDFGPRKNVDLLVRVHRSVVEAGQYHGNLVLVGGDGRYSTVARQPQLALQPIGAELPETPQQGLHVYDIGRVPDSDLSQLYASADLLVNLSSAEGFGYPVIEALAHGTPALVTTGTAMADIAGGGIAKTTLEVGKVKQALISALNALPLLRQEAATLPADSFTIERLGEQLAQEIES